MQALEKLADIRAVAQGGYPQVKMDFMYVHTFFIFSTDSCIFQIIK